MFAIFHLPPDFLLKTDDKPAHESTTGQVESREVAYAKLNLMLPLRKKDSNSQLIANLDPRTILENWPEPVQKAVSASELAEPPSFGLIIVLFLEQFCQLLIFRSKENFEKEFTKHKDELSQQCSIQYFRCYFSNNCAQLEKTITPFQLPERQDFLGSNPHLFHSRLSERKRRSRSTSTPTMRSSSDLPEVDPTITVSRSAPNSSVVRIDIDDVESSSHSSDNSHPIFEARRRSSDDAATTSSTSLPPSPLRSSERPERHPDPEALDLKAPDQSLKNCCLLL